MHTSENMKKDVHTFYLTLSSPCYVMVSLCVLSSRNIRSNDRNFGPLSDLRAFGTGNLSFFMFCFQACETILREKEFER
jgi:hypothetical protein